MISHWGVPFHSADVLKHQLLSDPSKLYMGYSVGFMRTILNLKHVAVLNPIGSGVLGGEVDDSGDDGDICFFPRIDANCARMVRAVCLIF